MGFPVFLEKYLKWEIGPSPFKIPNKIRREENVKKIFYSFIFD